VTNRLAAATGKRLMEGARVLILEGQFSGEEGVCLGAADGGQFSVSPDSSDAILTLEFETEFGLLVDLSGSPSSN
jgi:hypothetical protein